MPEMTSADLARIRAAVQWRDGCVRAALAHYRRVDLQPVDTYARAAFDAMAPLIEARVRARVVEEIATALEARAADHDVLGDAGAPLESPWRSAAAVAREHVGLAPLPAEPAHHQYLSTACWHGQREPDPTRAAELHGYCAGAVRWDGENKVPAKCKFCDAKCSCACHRKAITEEHL